ncbi:MAG: hypothetical protein AAB768_01830 [Patescibacteria group bacterium]
MEIVAIAIVISTMVATWASFLVSLLAKNLVVWPAVVGFVITFIIIIKFIKIKTSVSCVLFPVTVIGWSIYLIKLFSQMLVETPDGIWAGGSNVWGDWAGHIGYIANWLYGANWPPQNPWYSGIRLAYPFLFDYTSAILAKIGLSIPWSLQLPGIIFSIILVVLIYKLTLRITKSNVAAVLAISIFMFSGGLGFMYKDTKELTHSYEHNIQWVNFVISEMIPQRGILIGLTAAISIFILWESEYFLLAGITAGLIPFFHAHTYLVILGISGIYYFYKPKWVWWKFFLPAIVLAIPQLLYFLPQTSGFVHWQPGWAAHVQKDNWLWFWFKNIGFMLPLLPIAWATSFFKFRRLFWLYLPFILIFVVSNLLIFQPWENDNSKMLRFWYLGSSILAGWYLIRIPKVIALILFVTIIYSGAYDAGSWLNFEKNKLMLWNRSDMESAEFIKTNTIRGSVFLTNDNHNHWLVDLAGRKIVLGFRGWLWSWGINYADREADVRRMFTGSADTADLLQKYSIDYVLIGDGEKSNFGADEKYFVDRYPMLLDTGSQKIFDVR